MRIHSKFGYIGSDKFFCVHKEGEFTTIGRTLEEALAEFIQHFQRNEISNGKE